jgi:hypothetical protein
MTLKNNSTQELNVIVEPGTWFQAGSSSVQNMLVTAKYTVSLGSNESKTVYVDTACMNMTRDIPGSSNSFTISYHDSSSKLAKLAKYVDEHNTSYPVIQCAVWMITDNASGSQLLQSLVDQSGRSVVDQSDVDEARRIVNGL